jgi:hypothetical protein
MLMSWLVACEIEERLPIELPVVAGGTEVSSLATADGGTVELETATVTFTDLRLEEPAWETTTAALIRRFDPIATAMAHPGHDQAGDVAAELLGTFTVDLLADDTVLGTARGYEGTYATGRVHLSGVVAELTGTFTSASGEARPFAFTVAADQDVVGIPFDETLRAASPPAEVDLRFDTAHALSFVDWTEPDGDGDGTLTMADGTFGNTTTFGVVSTPSWSLTLVR